MSTEKKHTDLNFYIIGTLAVAILVLSSIVYKNNNTPTAAEVFPIPEATKQRVEKDVEVPMYLFVFMSKRNCHDCLEVVKELNDLPPQFIVTGIVPHDQLDTEKEVRMITGAEFPLLSLKDFKKYEPWYTPSIIGTSYKGTILFSMPGVPNEKEYVKKFLDSLYGKLFPIFLEEMYPQK